MIECVSEPDSPDPNSPSVGMLAELKRIEVGEGAAAGFGDHRVGLLELVWC